MARRPVGFRGNAIARRAAIAAQENHTRNLRIQQLVVAEQNRRTKFQAKQLQRLREAEQSYKRTFRTETKRVTKVLGKRDALELFHEYVKRQDIRDGAKYSPEEARRAHRASIDLARLEDFVRSRPEDARKIFIALTRARKWHDDGNIGDGGAFNEVAHTIPDWDYIGNEFPELGYYH